MPMLYSFTNIKFGLMVGIGAGIPTLHDVRLGDVVVSQPSGISGGVLQYDLGKAKHNEWERKDFLARPPEILLKALSMLQTEHESRIPQAYEYLRTALTKNEYWGHFYRRPDTNDYLFPSSYLHRVGSFGDTRPACDPIRAIKRSQRPPHMEFKIHYGVIASGNSLVKDAKLRDWIASMDEKSVCIEMEAAGIMNNFPCLVIRGICDYADSHKNDAWQRYACATVAAVSKELLSFVPLTDSKTATKATEVLQVPNIEHFTLTSYVNRFQQAEHRTLSGMSPDKSASSVTEVETTETHDLSRYLFLKEEMINIRFGEKNDTLLNLAAREGDVEKAARLIECGADIEAKNNRGGTPLYIAAQKGHLDVAKLLIKHKADTEATNLKGCTVLYVAASHGQLEVVKLLIEEHEANIEAAGSGVTPLHVAAQQGHLDVVRFLLKKGANIHADGLNSALNIAISNGHKQIVELLKTHSSSQKPRGNGNQPLSRCTKKNR